MPERVCPWWMAYSFDNPFRRLFHNPEKMFGAYISQGMTVMDAGCGMGYFSIGMAKLVGATGKVISVDLQQKMLDTLSARAKRAGVLDRIQTRLCQSDNIGVSDKVDFTLAFWMAHEVPDMGKFFGQVRACMKPDAKFLVAEPKFHVHQDAFNKTIETAKTAGLKLVANPPVKLSYSALLGI